MPRSIWSDDVNRVLAAVDRRTPVGKRNYAILLLLVTYGLRGPRDRCAPTGSHLLETWSAGDPGRQGRTFDGVPPVTGCRQSDRRLSQARPPSDQDRHVFFPGRPLHGTRLDRRPCRHRPAATCRPSPSAINHSLRARSSPSRPSRSRNAASRAWRLNGERCVRRTARTGTIRRRPRSPEPSQPCATLRRDHTSAAFVRFSGSAWA